VDVIAEKLSAGEPKVDFSFQPSYDRYIGEDSMETVGIKELKKTN